MSFSAADLAWLQANPPCSRGSCSGCDELPLKNSRLELIVWLPSFLRRDERITATPFLVFEVPCPRDALWPRGELAQLEPRALLRRVQGKLQVRQPCVETAAAQQLGVPSLLDDASLLKHENTTGALHGSEAVRDYERGAVPHQKL